MVTSTISLMVPGRVAITTMRSARKMDSEMLWVTNTTVFLCPSLPDPEQLLLHHLAGLGVEGAERLVHEEHGGMIGEDAGDGHALLHPARQLAGELVLVLGEADQREIPARGRPSLRLR